MPWIKDATEKKKKFPKMFGYAEKAVPIQRNQPPNSLLQMGDNVRCFHQRINQ